LGLGLVAEAAGETPMAKQHFENALEIDPQLLEARQGLARVKKED
jgi:hypothetical protein